MEAGQCSLCHETHAKFACSCRFPTIPLCEGCIITHLGTEGAHMPIPIKKLASAGVPATGNETCDECRNRAAVRFCLCTTPLRKFCEQCDIVHYQKAPLLTHSKHPIVTYQAVATGRVPIETFRKKQLYINDFQLRIGEELTNFDAFMRQVEGEFDQALGKVAAKKEEIVRNLQTQRALLVSALNTAQQEIETKRYAEALIVATVLDEYLVNGYVTSAVYGQRMFAGKIELAGIYSTLEKAMTCELTPNVLQEKTEIHPIPVIKGNSLRLFHPITLQMSQLPLTQTTEIDQSSAYCYIGNDTVLSCGGGSGSSVHSEVYEISIRTGRVERAPSMKSNRSWVGIWCTNLHVYVFGGLNGRNHLHTAEKYELARKPWANLPNAMPKSMYLPSICEHSSGLYLSGCEYSSGTPIVHFNIDNEVFSLLRFDVSYKGYSILCCLGEELYYIKQGTIEVASLSRGPDGVKFAVKGSFPPIGDGNYWLCCPMAFREGQLTSVLNQGENPSGLFCFNPAKDKFTQVATFTY